MAQQNNQQKPSASKQDLDMFLANIKVANQLSTQRPYSCNLIQQFRAPVPITKGITSIDAIQIDDEEKQKSSKPLNPKQVQNSIFTDYVILFPCTTVSLTKLRINVMCELISKNGGIAFFTQNFVEQAYRQLFLSALQKDKGFIVVARDTPEPAIEKSLKSIQLPMNEVQRCIVATEWVSGSLTKGQILNHDTFQLFSPPSQVTEQQLKQFKLNDDNKIGPAATENDKSKSNLEPKIQQEAQKQSDQMIERQCSQSKEKHSISPSPMRQMNDEECDQDFFQAYKHNNSDNSYDENGSEFEIDLSFLKCEEKQEKIEEHTNKAENRFVGDEDCCITDVIKKKTKIQSENQESIFEGINIQENVVNVDDPLLTSQIRDMTVFNNPGFKRKNQFWEQRKDKFTCESGSSKENHNQHIIEHLDTLLKCYTNDRDKGRVIAYKRAIAFLKSLKFQIKSEEDVKNMPTIGDKIKKKIVEILQTGHLKKADNLSSTAKNKCIELFSQVWGIGPQTAVMYYFKGFRTLDDLRKNQQFLSKNQKIGLKYVDEFKVRIPRDECTIIVDKIKEKLKEMSEPNDVYEAIACGSYRRGKPDCGDIDILITRKDGKQVQGFLHELVLELEKVILTDHLSLPNPSSHGSESYMGVGQLDVSLPHRRIDMKYYPREQFGYAVLYFTGSDHFNRSMRLFAQKKGYTLSDHGLYPTLRTTKNQKVWTGELIPCYTEEDVFKVLNISYKRPDERSV